MFQDGKRKTALVALGSIGLVTMIGLVFLYLKNRLEVSPQPEIPINEYWDYSRDHGLFDGNRLYINNTDKGLIYALNAEGKVVWKIDGKEYGFSYFEIWPINSRLLLTASTYDELKNYYNILFVFDLSGRLRWKHVANGYLDMPKSLVTPDNHLIVHSNTRVQKCDSGCGVICPKKIEYCDQHLTSAFDIETGRILWANTTRDLYSYAMVYQPDDTIKIRSAGDAGGIHGWQYTYILDAQTGEIESVKATVGFNDGKQLIYSPQDKKITINEAPTDTIIKEFSSTTELFQLIEKAHANKTHIVFSFLEDTLFGQEFLPDRKGNWYLFDMQDGHFIWKQPSLPEHVFITPPYELDGKLLLNLKFQTGCSVYADSKLYNKCRTDEYNDPSFNSEQIRVIDAKTGKLAWKFDSKKNYIYQGLGDIDGIRSLRFVELVGGEQIQIDLDAYTGKVIYGGKRTFDEMY